MTYGELVGIVDPLDRTWVVVLWMCTCQVIGLGLYLSISLKSVCSGDLLTLRTG